MVIEEITTHPCNVKGQVEAHEVVRGLWWSIQHLTKIGEWDRALKLVHLKLNTKIENTFFDQLGAWGYFDLQLKILANFKNENRTDIKSFYLHNSARVQRNLNNYQRAEELFYKSISIFQDLGDNREVGWLYHALGVLKLEEPDLNEAKKLLLKSITVFEGMSSPDQIGIAQACHNLTRVYTYFGNYFSASKYYDKAVNIYKENPGLGAPENKAWVFHGYSDFLCETGDYLKSEYYGKKALSLFEDHFIGTAWSHARLAKMYFFYGKYDMAQNHLLQAQKKFNEINDTKGLTIAANTHWKIAIVKGNVPATIGVLKRLFSMPDIRKDELRVMFIIEGAFCLCAHLGLTEVSVYLLGKAEELKREMQKGSFQADRNFFGTFRDKCTKRLSTQRFEALLKKGRNKPTKEILTEVRRILSLRLEK